MKKSRKIEKIEIKVVKINELIILSGSILSWTVCVESSCFLTPVGRFSSVACPVFLLTICVGSCQLAFVQRRGLRRERPPADLCDGTPV